MGPEKAVNTSAQRTHELIEISLSAHMKGTAGTSNSTLDFFFFLVDIGENVTFGFRRQFMWM